MATVELLVEQLVELKVEQLGDLKVEEPSRQKTLVEVSQLE